MKRLVAVISVSVLMSAVPSVAFGLSASSSQGSISGGPSKWYHNGADMKVTLNSWQDNPVYGSGLKVYDGLADQKFGRFTSDVNDDEDRLRYGRIGTTANYSVDVDGVKIRVCRNINNLPDSCSSWSGTARNPIAD